MINAMLKDSLLQMMSSHGLKDAEGLATHILNAKSPLDILQLPGSASFCDAKAQFRKIALLLHPDKASGRSAYEAFQRATQALNSLKGHRHPQDRHVLNALKHGTRMPA